MFDTQLSGGRIDVRYAVRTYKTGRTCGVEGCRTKLSKYNPLDWCNTHAYGRPRRLPYHTADMTERFN